MYRQVDVLELRCASDNNTVLHIASSSGKLELVNNILIQRPELMVQENSHGDLPIHSALKSGTTNVAVVDALMRWLQQQQASSNIVTVRQVLERSNFDGNTALHIALLLFDEEQCFKLADLYSPASYAMNIEGICPLYLAIEKEFEILVQRMLPSSQPVNDAIACLKKGQSVLHAAVSAHSTEMLEHLLRCDDGILINLMNEEGLTALSYAASKGYLEKVKIFCNIVPKSASICNKDRSFPIHQAVIRGYSSIIGLLSSSSIFLLNAKGQNILNLAISTGVSKLVSYVLSLSDASSLLNQMDNNGYTPLHLATLGKHVEIVEMLIQNEGVNVGLLNKEGLTANDLAKKLDQEFVDDADRNLVRRLNLMLERATYMKLFPIDEKVYLHLANREINEVSKIVWLRRLQLKNLLTLEEGNNVLHVAVCMDNSQLIYDLLVGHNCPTLMYQANRTGDLPIHLAVKAGKLKSVEVLLRWSTTIPSDHICERGNMDGNTALHIALLCSHKEIANYLHEQWPRATYCLNKDNVCPLFLAIKNWSTSESDLINSMIQGLEGDTELQNRLKGAESIVHIAIFVKTEDILERIINKASSLLDSVDGEGRGSLSYAALSGHVKGVKLLLENFPDLEYKRDKDKEGSFPIHQAVKGGYAKVIRLFRPVRLLNNKGQNILHVAAENNKLGLFLENDKLVLLLSGVKRLKCEELINTIDNNGNTPLHLAVKGFHLRAVFRLLRCQHINDNLKNKELQTPLDIFIMHMNNPKEKGLQSMQIHLMDLMLNNINGRASISRARRDDKEQEEKEREIKVAKSNFYANKNKGALSTKKERANSLLVVATLIITVTFAAGINPPGGYSEQTSALRLLSHKYFRKFVDYNSVAFACGIASAITLIFGMNIKNIAEISLLWGGYFILIGLFCIIVSFSNVLLLYVAKKESLTTGDMSKSIESVKSDERLLLIMVLTFLGIPIMFWSLSKFKVTLHLYLGYLIPFVSLKRKLVG